MSECESMSLCVYLSARFAMQMQTGCVCLAVGWALEITCYPLPLLPRTYSGTSLQCSWFFRTGFPANPSMASML